jgi:hypothetical protein
MPAFLAIDEWATWLGESGSSPDDAKACRMTVEGIKLTMSKEERASTRTKRSDPGGLFLMRRLPGLIT